MIQRKQTLFLLAALVLTVICLCFPIGYISPKLMGADAVIYNLGVKGVQFSSYLGWVFMLILVLVCTICVAAIFCFQRRRLQMKLCTLCEVLCAAWYIYLLYSSFMIFSGMGNFRLNWTAVLPLVNIVLFAMAHSGIKKDEDLVRSADRIR